MRYFWPKGLGQASHPRPTCLSVAHGSLLNHTIKSKQAKLNSLNRKHIRQAGYKKTESSNTESLIISPRARQKLKT